MYKIYLTNNLIGLKNNILYIKGLLGVLRINLKFKFNFYIENNYFIYKSSFNYTTFIKNAMLGSNNFFSKIIELNGLGFKFLKFENSILNIRLGSSVRYIKLDKKLDVNILNKEGTKIELKGIDRQKVGWFSSRIKFLYPVEPYKARGISIAGQYIFRKSGKKIN